MCEHDHGNELYSCNPGDLVSQPKLWCIKHHCPFYGECSFHVMEEIRDSLIPRRHT